ncbi:MAG: hypothetical protein JST83_14615 [Bacteroidetes bacterium]|nr:hypothetical protein [Bacteroidota bacterium]
MGQYIWAVGIIASIGTGGCMLPQLIKVIQTRKTEGLSRIMIAVLIASLSLWIVYGAGHRDWIIILSNAVSLLINCCLLILTFIFKRSPSRHYF